MTDLLIEPVVAPPARPAPLLPLAARVVVVVVAVVGAYHYSLTTLVRALSVDSPLAYLGLIPFIAVGICWYTARPAAGEPEVHDRYLDRIIGVPLVIAPVLVLLILPTQLSTYFWVWRIDLLTLPLFAAGCVALILGSRTLIRMRLGILWLFAAWPVPYQFALQHGLEPFTGFTVKALRSTSGILGSATFVPGGDGAFSVDGPGRPFTVVVASACSGANSLVGFLIVASATAMLSRGTRRAKLTWVGVGSALVWMVNVVRVLVIFAVGDIWGERTAIDVFHPYIGLVFFSIAVTTMMLLAPRFGVRLGGRRHSAIPLRASVERGATKWMAAGSVVLVLAVVAGGLDDQLRVVDPVAGALGTPRLGAFAQTATEMEGFEGKAIDHFDWTQRFFGEDSDWTRYEFDGPGTISLAASIPIIADVVTTSDVQTFNDFGVEACYKFHGYDVADEQRVDLGSGVTGNVLTWKDPSTPITWNSVYWHWPVSTPDGVRYQRIVLMFNTSTGAQVAAPQPSNRLASSLGISLDRLLNDEGDGPGGSARNDRTRVFLVSFAQQMVRDSAARSAELAARTNGGGS
ncbi:MAG: exosortase/archaeosortase family protein [Acidimicrobiales bacterium]